MLAKAKARWRSGTEGGRLSGVGRSLMNAKTFMSFTFESLNYLNELNSLNEKLQRCGSHVEVRGGRIMSRAARFRSCQSIPESTRLKDIESSNKDAR